MNDIHEQIALFRKRFPDFKTFAQPGETFLENEDRYKRGTAEFFRKRFGGWVNGKVTAWSPAEFRKQVNGLLKEKIPDFGVQNFANWRDQAAIFDKLLSTEKDTQALMSFLHPLLVGAQQGDVHDPLDRLLNWLREKELSKALQKLLVTLLLWLWNSDRFIFIKPRIFDRFLKRIGEDTVGDMTADGYLRVLRVMQDVSQALGDLKPRDMIDLQSFYYVVEGHQGEPEPGKESKEVKKPAVTEGRPLPLNLILYGPPGTGKTWTLRNEYMERFTDHASALSKEDFAAELVADLAWWQVITIVMMELKTSKVSAILDHPLTKARIRRSNNRSPRAAIWAHLQMHTKTDCPEVKYAKRYEPLLFSKDAKSVWSIDTNLATEETPDLVETLKLFRGFKPGKGAVIKRYEFTTFHQSYSYEDFVEGIKPIMSEEVPDTLAYEVKPGIFKTMVQRALADPNHNYALLIDEISRGNVSNIFGELITLIEDDKRQGALNELCARLPYSREEFVVPKNLHIIGAMNTADRSVEALDTALRRRFTFVAIQPQPDLIQQPAKLAVDLRKLLGVINARIEKLLDKDHCIGHSFFMGIAESSDPLVALQTVFATKILPLLEEYFYGDPGKIGMVLGERFVSRKDAAIEWAAGDWGMDDFEERHVYALQDPMTMKAEDFRTVYE